MNKLILKLGWPGALLLLVGALSLGVYTIVNQSILDEQKKESGLNTGCHYWARAQRLT